MDWMGELLFYPVSNWCSEMLLYWDKGGFIYWSHSDDQVSESIQTIKKNSVKII